MDVTPGPGRPRDPDIDTSVLAAAQDHLARFGYEGMSLSAVADAAGTTRQPCIGRWSTKADLATAAIADLASHEAPANTGDAFADLISELRAFHRGVERPNGLSLVGTMLQDSVEPSLLRLYRERLVAPRRERIRAVLDRAAEEGSLDPEADLDLVVASATGMLYSLHLAGGRVGRAWPTRAARVLWRAAGGTPPGE